MKLCYKCKQEKPFISFHKNKNTNDGFHKRCKECQKFYMRQYYKNCLKYKVKVADKRKKRGLKTQTKCLLCEEDDYSCLDYHHIDPSTKKCPVSNLTSYGACWELIQNEIDKCILLCSNCHRKFHVGRFSLLLRV